MEKDNQVLSVGCQNAETEEFKPYNYFNCMQLLHECIKNNLLRTDPNDGNRVLVYREKGEKFPEGWYSENIFDIARDLMGDVEGQQFLTKELLKIGVTFKEKSFL